MAREIDSNTKLPSHSQSTAIALRLRVSVDNRPDPATLECAKGSDESDTDPTVTRRVANVADAKKSASRNVAEESCG
jgi:hypothetical protein